MAKFIIFTIVLLLAFSYAMPDSIVQRIPYASEAKSFIVDIANQAKALISNIISGSLIKQFFQQSVTSAIDVINNAKANLKDNIRQRVGEEIDKGIDRLIPIPSQ